MYICSVSWTLKSKNNASQWLKFRVQVSQLFLKIIIFTFIVVVIIIFITPSNLQKNLLIVTVGQCTWDPHARLAWQKYKRLNHDWMKNTDTKEIVSQLGVASTLFSPGETRAEKAGVVPGIFPWWGITGNMCNIGAMMSAEDIRN